MQRIPLCTLLLALFSPTLGWGGSKHEYVNMKKYGSCAVVTQVDLMSDHMRVQRLTCLDRTRQAGLTVFKEPSLPPFVSIWVKNKHYEDVWMAGVRLDKEAPIYLDVRWDKATSQAVVLEPDFVKYLLRELPGARRILLDLGEDVFKGDLNGSARAVKDFLQRMGTTPGNPSPPPGDRAPAKPIAPTIP